MFGPGNWETSPSHDLPLLPLAKSKNLKVIPQSVPGKEAGVQISGEQGALTWGSRSVEGKGLALCALVSTKGEAVGEWEGQDLDRELVV